MANNWLGSSWRIRLCLVLISTVAAKAVEDLVYVPSSLELLHQNAILTAGEPSINLINTDQNTRLHKRQISVDDPTHLQIEAVGSIKIEKTNVNRLIGIIIEAPITLMDRESIIVQFQTASGGYECRWPADLGSTEKPACRTMSTAIYSHNNVFITYKKILGPGETITDGNDRVILNVTHWEEPCNDEVQLNEQTEGYIFSPGFATNGPVFDISCGHVLQPSANYRVEFSVAWVRFGACNSSTQHCGSQSVDITFLYENGKVFSSVSQSFCGTASRVIKVADKWVATDPYWTGILSQTVGQMHYANVDSKGYTTQSGDEGYILMYRTVHTADPAFLSVTTQPQCYTDSAASMNKTLDFIGNRRAYLRDTVLIRSSKLLRLRQLTSISKPKEPTDETTSLSPLPEVFLTTENNIQHISVASSLSADGVPSTVAQYTEAVTQSTEAAPAPSEETVQTSAAPSISVLPVQPVDYVSTLEPETLVTVTRGTGPDQTLPPQKRTLEELSRIPLHLKNVGEILGEAVSIIQDIHETKLNSEDIHFSSIILEHAANVRGLPHKEVNLSCNFFDCLLNANASAFLQENSNRMLAAVNALAINANLTENTDQIEFAGKNFCFALSTVTDDDDTWIFTQPGPSGGQTPQEPEMDTDQRTFPAWNDSQAQIVVALKNAPSKKRRRSAETAFKNCTAHRMRMSFQLYRVTKLFQERASEAKQSSSSSSVSAVEMFRKINFCDRMTGPDSLVISASIHSSPIETESRTDAESGTVKEQSGEAAGSAEQLQGNANNGGGGGSPSRRRKRSQTADTKQWLDVYKPYVQVAFARHNAISKFDRNFDVSCGYWAQTEWKFDGCDFVERTDTHYRFNATHLTDFALLVSNNPKDLLFCDEGLRLTGSVGTLLSVVALTAVVLSLIWIRLTDQKNQSIICVSICFNVTLLLLFAMFYLFADQQFVGIEDYHCSTAAAVMYYLQLSVLVWTMCRAHLVYRRYVVVFDSGGSNCLCCTTERLYAVAAIVLPLILVLILANVTPNVFLRRDFHCYINPEVMIYATMIPFSLTIFVTVFVLLMVARSIFRQRVAPESSIRGRNKGATGVGRKLWVLFVLQITLGVPWVFQYLTFSERGALQFHYLFAFASAFQGVWIALIHFYERRNEFKLLLQWLRKIGTVFKERAFSDDNDENITRKNTNIMRGSISNSNGRHDHRGATHNNNNTVPAVAYRSASKGSSTNVDTINSSDEKYVYFEPVKRVSMHRSAEFGLAGSEMAGNLNLNGGAGGKTVENDYAPRPGISGKGKIASDDSRMIYLLPFERKQADNCTTDSYDCAISNSSYHDSRHAPNNNSSPVYEEEESIYDEPKFDDYYEIVPRENKKF